MNIDSNSVKVILDVNFNPNIAEEIVQNIKTIFTTPMGTVPFDREFGIDWSILDQPLERAKGLLTVEYIEKTRKYEPRAKVQEVHFESESDKGVLIPKVVIGIA